MKKIYKAKQRIKNNLKRKECSNFNCFWDNNTEKWLKKVKSNIKSKLKITNKKASSESQNKKKSRKSRQTTKVHLKLVWAIFWRSRSSSNGTSVRRTSCTPVSPSLRAQSIFWWSFSCSLFWEPTFAFENEKCVSTVSFFPCIPYASTRVSLYSTFLQTFRPSLLLRQYVLGYICWECFTTVSL